MKNRLSACAALLTVGAGGLLGLGTATSSAPGSTPPLPARTQSYQPEAARSLGHRTSCLDLPLSSALILPDSCWQTGPTALLVAGSTPSQATTGALAVVSGQVQHLATLAGSGPLRVIEVGPGTACVEDAHGSYHEVSLGQGTVASAGSARCASTRTEGGGSSSPARLASNSVPLTANQGLTDVPPPVTPSYYEYHAYVSQCQGGSAGACPLYQQGQATSTPSAFGLVVLDFGAPCSTMTSPVQYGTQLFEGSACTPDSTLQQLVQQWIDGYESDHGAGTPAITLGIGTSNSENGIDPGPSYGPVSLQQSAHGWYQLVSGSYSIPGSAPIVRWGASDIEQASSGWWDSADSDAWVRYYSQAAGFTSAQQCSLSQPGFLADYGDNIVGGTRSQDGWTAANVFAVAQGTPGTCAVPEIYYSSMASEWSALSAAFPTPAGLAGISFTGVMVEAVGGTLTATQAWTTLQGQTNQSPSIPALTQIAPYGDFQVQGQPPEVTGVAPLYGPITGGTSVTVSGSNFYAVAQVYFGQVPAQSFTVESTGTIFAIAPANLAGTVDVVVETSLGSSSTGAADQFLYTGPPCTAVAATPNPSAVAAGTSVTVDASASCPPGSLAKYSYFTRAGSSGAWSLRAAWTGASWTWSTAGLGAGSYQVLVWASDGPYTVPQSQAIATITVGAQAASTSSSCTAIAVNLPGSASSGSALTVTASATCGSGADPLYSYFTRAGSGGGWTLHAAWIGPSWTWSTAGLPAGPYQVLVWASAGPFTVPQVQQAASVQLSSGSACTAVQVSAPAGAAGGSSLTATASSTCPAGSHPEYSYFTRAGNGGAWTLRAAWIGPSWTWSTAGLATGAYQVLVWVSDGPYSVPQAQLAASVQVTGEAACSSVSVTASPSNPAAGEPVGVRASATCPAGAAAAYTYFVGPSGSGPWTLKAAWVGASWQLSTGSLPAGLYYVLAWASDGPFTVPQVQSATSFELGGPGACSAVSVAAYPTSAAPGSEVAATASATCPGGTSPEYSYFVSSSSAGPWTLEAAWIGGAWTWSPVGLAPGTYYILAWASDGPYTVPQVQAITAVSVS